MRCALNCRAAHVLPGDPSFTPVCALCDGCPGFDRYQGYTTGAAQGMRTVTWCMSPFSRETIPGGGSPLLNRLLRDGRVRDVEMD
jgi:hypothetical protein